MFGTLIRFLLENQISIDGLLTFFINKCINNVYYNMLQLKSYEKKKKNKKPTLIIIAISEGHFKTQNVYNSGPKNNTALKCIACNRYTVRDRTGAARCWSGRSK